MITLLSSLLTLNNTLVALVFKLKEGQVIINPRAEVHKLVGCIIKNIDDCDPSDLKTIIEICTSNQYYNADLMKAIRESTAKRMTMKNEVNASE